MPKFPGQVAVVTGAGRGIGAAVAEMLAGAGCRVALVGRTRADLDETERRATSRGGEALVIEADVSREEDVRGLFERSRERFGPAEILVNNAAILETSPVAEMDIDSWDRVIGTNLRGVFLCAREAMRQMIPRKRGAIVNVSSISGVPKTQKWPGYAAYCASKGGVNLFTEVLAIEGRPHGIRVNSISPGAVQTRMWARSAGGEADMSPDEVARAILFLLSDDARPMQGTNLEIFG